jgi:membrane protein DedA with SNARE-associated domain
MLAIMLLTFGLVYSRDRDEHVRAALAVLSFASLLGFGVLFWISRRIRAHVDMLMDVLKPLDGVGRLSSDARSGGSSRER